LFSAFGLPGVPFKVFWMVTKTLVKDQFFRCTPIKRAQANPFLLSYGNTRVSFLFVQLGICRKSNIFLLRRAVYQYLTLLSLLAMQLDGYLQNSLDSFLADPFSEVDKVCRVTGKIPLKLSLPQKYW
jgi:hypothetical protein